MTCRIICIILLITMSYSAFARSLTSEERGALAGMVVRYEAAVLEKDYWAIGAAFPPRLLERYVAARGFADLEPDRWVGLYVQDTEAIDKNIGNKIETFTLGWDNAEFKETADGTPYVILPSVTVGKSNVFGRTRVSAQYLALLDEGKWYITVVAFGGLLGSVEGVYPSFEGIEFDPATQEQL
ncbi:hypothetical protein [Roseibium sp.]|uniref:hypothetical protein n=1 Tax=Roseibium sp. TaxID=1936156 RepID=UPI003B521C74